MSSPATRIDRYNGEGDKNSSASKVDHDHVTTTTTCRAAVAVDPAQDKNPAHQQHDATRTLYTIPGRLTSPLPPPDIPPPETTPPPATTSATASRSSSSSSSSIPPPSAAPSPDRSRCLSTGSIVSVPCCLHGGIDPGDCVTAFGGWQIFTRWGRTSALVVLL